MKKILIVNNNLHIGGVQKALVSLLWNIHDRCEVTLLLFWPHGTYMQDLPEDIKIVQADSAYRYLGMPKTVETVLSETNAEKKKDGCRRKDNLKTYE